MDHATIKKHIQKMETVHSHEEKQILAVQGFLELFKVKRATLYYYSTLSKVGEGILRITEQGNFPLQDWREDVRNMPPIYASIRERRSKHISGELIQQIPAKFIVEVNKVNSFLVVPLFNPSTVMGYVTIHSFGVSVEENLLHSLTFYGELLGKIFENDDTMNSLKKLSKREIEVLQRLSWGESIKEVADYLKISEYTVQDYVRSAMKKLGVQNRVQGVAEAIRRKIIT